MLYLFSKAPLSISYLKAVRSSRQVVQQELRDLQAHETESTMVCIPQFVQELMPCVKLTETAIFGH